MIRGENGVEHPKNVPVSDLRRWLLEFMMQDGASVLEFQQIINVIKGILQQEKNNKLLVSKVMQSFPAFFLLSRHTPNTRNCLVQLVF